MVPLLAVVRIGKVFENSTDYSFQNTLRQALFLPTTREASRLTGHAESLARAVLDYGSLDVKDGLRKPRPCGGQSERIATTRIPERWSSYSFCGAPTSRLHSSRSGRLSAR